MNLAALEIVIRENDLPRHKQDRLIKKLRKKEKQGRFKLDLSDPQWVWRLASANLMNRDYSFWGWQFRSAWALDLFRSDWIYPKWDGQNHRCLVLAEQGIGDEILFASVFGEFLKECPEAVIECDDRLLPIFERSFDGNFISRWRRGRGKGNHLKDYKKDEFDSFVPAGDLLQIYRMGKKPPGTPYLKPKETVKTENIGISWEGGRSHLTPDHFKCDNAVNIQYQKKDGKYVSAECPEWMGDDHLNHDDMEQIFSYVSGLKEVRSVFSYMCHVAGSMGVPCKAVKPPYQVMTELGTGNNRLKWPYQIGKGSWKTDWYNSMTVCESWKQL